MLETSDGESGREVDGMWGVEGPRLLQHCPVRLASSPSSRGYVARSIDSRVHMA
jgi:hypothetical protein